jgi:small-conductance mechanosensitive channel
MNYLSDQIFGNLSNSLFLATVLIFTGVYITCYLLLKLTRKLILYIKNEETRKVFTQNLNTLNWFFCLAVALRFSLDLLGYLQPTVIQDLAGIPDWLQAFSFIIISYFGIVVVEQWLIFLFRVVVEKNQKDTEKFDPEGLTLVTTLIRFVVWIIGLIFILKNFNIQGFDTLVTSLGITGIAVAFALQNILSEIFASFSIFLDKPFIVGDYVEIGTDKGYVQRIGIRSTRITSLSGEEIVISNKELVATRIHNFKLLKSRRVSFDLFLDLKTPSVKLKLIPELIKSIIEKQPKTKFDRVSFMQIGEAKFRFEVVYYVLSNDYKNFTITQQGINFGILDQFEKNGIELV